MSMEAGAAQPQPQRVPVDEGGRPLGEERVSEDEPQQVPVGQLAPGEVQARVELEALGLVLVDRDAQP
jgi:hypothetical protein